MHPPTAAALAALLLLLLAASAAAAGGRQLLQAPPLLDVKNEPGKISLSVNTDSISKAVNDVVTSLNDAVRSAGSSLQNIQLPRLPIAGQLLNATEGLLQPNRTGGAAGLDPSVLASSLDSVFNPLGFDDRVDNRNCISDPRQFIEAFLQRDNARRNLCVSDRLIFRLSGGPGSSEPALTGNLTVTLNRFYDSLGIRPVTFWGFKDAGEKYMRIGRPRTTGSNVDGFPADPPNRNHYQSVEFPGIRDVSNGLSFLEQVGFESAFVDITKPWMLYVAERPTRTVPSFVPTWRNVVTFYSSYIGQVAGVSNFTISQEVAAVLDNTTFADLTGCPAQCTWQDRLFPQSPLNTSGRLESGNAVSPARIAIHSGTREAPGNCSAPAGVSTNEVDLDGTDSTSRFRLTAPTSVAEDDPLCSDEWRLYFERFGENCTGGARFTAAGIRTTALRFYQEFTAVPADDRRLQALVLRAYLATSCSGDFNPLYSGNGFTYTGSDGIVSPTVHEVLTGAVQRDQVEGRPRVLGNVAYTFFCLTGGEECCLGSNCGGVFPASAPGVIGGGGANP